MHLEQFQGLLNQVTEVVSLSLAIVNAVAHVHIPRLKQVHDRQDLAVVRYQSLANRVGACHECLQDFQRDCDDLRVTRIQRRLDRNNQLWYDWQHLGTALFEHIEYALHCKETVWIHFFANPFEENGQVVMIVQLLNFDLPIDSILRTVFYRNGQVAAVIKESELAHWNLPAVDGASYGS